MVYSGRLLQLASVNRGGSIRGNFKNGGAEWAPAGQPERVSVHDFADEELGEAVPYGSAT